MVEARKTSWGKRAFACGAVVAVIGSVGLINPRFSSAATEQSLWPQTTTPVHRAEVIDKKAAELGVKLVPSVNGTITGIRFFKDPSNTGVHTATLWSSTGSALAAGTFANETPSGWQTLRFSAAVPVEVGQIYVASYFAPNGGYADTESFFTTAATKGSLTTPVNAGVYRYGHGAPTLSWRSSNYWVDALFVAGATSASTPKTTIATSLAPQPTTTTTVTPVVTPTTTVAPGGACTASQAGANVSVPSGFPNADTTGYGDTCLTAYNGPMTITADNTVIDGKVIQLTGTDTALLIKGNNVVIKNSKVLAQNGDSCDQNCYTVQFSGSGGGVYNSELDGNAGKCFATITAGSSQTIQGNNIHDCGDGVRADGRIIGNFMHDFAQGRLRAPGQAPTAGTCVDTPHNDGVETDGAVGMVIQNNAIDIPDYDNVCTSSAGAAGVDSCIFDPDQHPEWHPGVVTNGVVIDHNYLNCSNYMIKVAGDGYGFTISNNVFGPTKGYGFFDDGGRPGASPGVQHTWTNNKTAAGAVVAG